MNDFDVRGGSLDEPDVQRLIEAWNEELTFQFPGFTPTTGSLVQEEEFRDTQGGRFLIAYLQNEAVGCGGLRRLDRETAEIKRLYVSPAARCRGVGRRILAELENDARGFDYGRVRLDTQRQNHAALRLFASSGYREIGDYNRNPLADVWLEKTL